MPDNEFDIIISRIKNMDMYLYDTANVDQVLQFEISNSIRLPECLKYLLINLGDGFKIDGNIRFMGIKERN